MYSTNQLIEWAKQGLARREMYVHNDYWEAHKKFINTFLINKGAKYFEYFEAEDILNLLLGAAYQFIKYNKVMDINEVYERGYKCPPPRLVDVYEKNYCGSIE